MTLAKCIASYLQLQVGISIDNIDYVNIYVVYIIYGISNCCYYIYASLKSYGCPITYKNFLLVVLHASEHKQATHNNIATFSNCTDKIIFTR